MSTCGECKYYAQSKTCSYCEHPEANFNEKNYRYYSMGCESKDKFEKGTSQSRIDWYNNLPKERKKVFEDMKDWHNQQWFKDLNK